MRDRLIELLRNAPKTDTVYGNIKLPEPVQTLQTIADHLLSEGVIVPPVKVGDTVYMLSRGKIIPMIVNSLSFNGNCEYMLNCHYEDIELYGYSVLTFSEKTKGDYWGITQEEAEKALKGADNG